MGSDRNALQDVMLRYAAGVEQLVTVLESQRRAVTNESRWISSQRERLDNRIDLLLALGGGFGAGEDVDATTDSDAAAEARGKDTL